MKGVVEKSLSINSASSGIPMYNLLGVAAISFRLAAAPSRTSVTLWYKTFCRGKVEFPDMEIIVWSSKSWFLEL